MDPIVEIDARGLICPLPVLRLRKALLGLSPGQVVRMVATDPVAVIDVPHFCAEAGHELISATPADCATAYLVRRGTLTAGESSDR
jgi:tRNA 2-thiouridine synthesizing protein A